MAGDPAAARWSHQLGRSPVMPRIRGHSILPSWASAPTSHCRQPASRSSLGSGCPSPVSGATDLVASHGAAGRCPLDSRTDCPAQDSSRSQDQRSSRRLGKGAVRQPGKRIRGQHLGCRGQHQGQRLGTWMELARLRWGLGQGSGQGEQELTGQGHGHTTSSCAHPPGNQRQERPRRC